MLLSLHHIHTVFLGRLNILANAALFPSQVASIIKSKAFDIFVLSIEHNLNEINESNSPRFRDIQIDSTKSDS